MSVTVNASTSVVLVETSKVTDNFIVYFPNYFSYGQFITVRDQDGFAAPDKPIILSSFNGTIFQPETSEIIIDEPYGFFTIQNISSGLFETVNSFNIPSSFATANSSNVRTSNIMGITTISFIDTVTQTEEALYSSNDTLFIGEDVVGEVNFTNLVSTVNNLGSEGYLSTVNVQTYIDFLPTYIATGYNSNQTNIQYSETGGGSWNDTVGTRGFEQYGTALTYSGDDNIFVASGQNNTGSANLGYLQWSTDGEEWFDSESPNLNNRQTRSAVLYANGLYHAVGSNGNTGGSSTILYSQDGINWQPSAGNPFSNGFATGIAYGNGIWVATGCTPTSSAACALWSSNGINWNTASTTAWTGICLYDVTFSGSRFIAICTNGSNTTTSNVCFSLNGSNWFSSNAYDANFRNNAQYITSGDGQLVLTTLNTNQKLAYSLDGGNSWESNVSLSVAGGQIYKPFFDGVKWFVSVGNNIRETWVTVGEAVNTVAASDDGSNWTGFGTSVFSSNGNAVAWNGALFVALGKGTTTIATSTDGYTWTSRGNSIFSTEGLAIGWNGYEFIAVGSGTTNTVAISSDGVNWVGLGNVVGGTPTKGAVAWNGALWVIGGNGTNKLRLSSEGFNWSNADISTTFATGCYGLAWSGRRFVAVGGDTGNTILYSTNGSNWFTTSGNTFTTKGNGVAWNGSYFLAVGEGGRTMTKSSDGITWSDSGITSPFTTAGNGIAWSGTRWVATGEGTNVIATSTDGNSWSGVAVGSVYTTRGIGVTYSSPLNRCPIWVATGRGTNTLAVSYTGNSWEGLGTSIFSTGANNIFWSGYMYVAVGEGTNTIATSLDGINWTGLGTGIFSTRGNGIAWSGSLWVAGGIGTNTIVTSPDGTNWTARTNSFTECQNIAWNGQLWVAVGSGTSSWQIATSTNGINWFAQTNPFTTCYGIAWSAQLGLWVAVGNGSSHTIASSPDGSNWTGRGKTMFTTEGRAVAWNGNFFVAAGIGGNSVATSGNGTSWVGRGNPGGITSGYGISWSGKTWIAAGTGTNNFANSPDGIYWTGNSGTGIFSTQAAGLTYTRINLPPIWVACGDDRSGGNGRIFATSINGSNFVSSIVGQDITVETNGAAYNGRIWLATGQSAPNTLIASVDGRNWYGRGTYVFDNYAVDIQWNGSLWVASGESARLATSPDGIFWTPRTMNWQFPKRILWDGKKWFACGNRGSGNATLMISYDGINWGANAIPFNDSTEQIAYNGSLYVAVGGGGANAFATSSDGLVWTGRGKPVLTNFVTGVAASSNLFVAVGQGSGVVIASSPDGITWTGRATGALFGNYGYAIGWNGVSWVAMGVPSSPGTTNTMARSSDGITWNALGTSNFYGDGRGIGNSFIPAYNSDVLAGVYFSTDLQIWNPTPSNTGFANGGVVTALTSRNTADDINILYQSSLLGFQNILNISSINAGLVSSVTITARSLFTSSLFVEVQNVSTTFENSSITSTIIANNAFVRFANAGTSFMQYMSINYISVNTIETRILFNEFLQATQVRASTLSTANLQLRANIISIGSNTGPAFNYGRINPQADSIGLGTLAGNFNARSNTVAIGYRAGFSNSSTGSIAIGFNAGSNTLGEYSIAIGNNAGSNFLSANTIYINASNDAVNTYDNSGFYVNPIGSASDLNNTGQLYYNTTSYEITYGPSFLSTFSTLNVSSLSVNGSSALDVNFQVNGVGNIQYIGRNFVLGDTLVNEGFNIDYNTVNVGRRNTEIISGKGGGSKGHINFYTAVTDNTIPTAANLAFTIANNRVGVNTSNPQVTMDIQGRLRAHSSISTAQTFISSINGLTLQPQFLVGSNLTLSTLFLGNSLINNTNSFVTSLSTNNLITTEKQVNFWVATGDDGSGSGSIKYSRDGSNWSNSASGGFGAFGFGYGVAYNGTLWVAVGFGTDSILYSLNGSNWSFSSSGSFSVLGYGVAWNGNLWVAAGWGANAAQSLKFSSNGSNWTNSSSGGFSSYGFDVAWNGSLWVAVGNDVTPNNTIQYSTDGSNWNNANSGGFTTWGHGIAWNGKLWVAVGIGATSEASIKYSSDGSNWNDANSGGFGTGGGTQGRGIAWNGSLWVAAGVGTSANAGIKYSSDGSNWNDANSGGQGSWNVAWNGRLWIVASAASGSSSLLYSSDGSNWSNANSGGFNNSGLGIATAFDYSQSTILINRPSKEIWVAVGGSTIQVASSRDGNTWTDRAPNQGAFTIQGNGVWWNGDLFVAVGESTNKIATSLDGIDWTNRSDTIFEKAGYGVTYGNNYWVAVGGDDTGVDNQIATSPDGVTWTARTSPFSSNGYGVAFNGNLFVALGEGDTNTIATSPDGITWTGRGKTVFDNRGRHAAWNGYMWVAVGGSTNTIAISYNGIDWTGLGRDIFSEEGIGVTWNGRLWVATGTSTIEIATSPDGINWTERGAGTFDTFGAGVAWHCSSFVAVGKGTNSIATSAGGYDWNGKGVGTFNDRGNDVAYSWTTYPDISLSNLNFYIQSQPTYTSTKNQIFTTPSSIVLNNTLYIERSLSSVGVNIGIPEYNLHVIGNMRCSSTLIGGLGVLSNTTALATSDSNIKENIWFADLNRCVEIVETVPLKRFSYIPEYKDILYDKSQIGFLAQDVEQVFPHATLTLYDDRLNKGIKYLSKDQIQMAHFGATQKLIQFIDYQKTQISTLYSRIEYLEQFMSTNNYSAFRVSEI